MRCTVHIDAGYLYAALATRATGSSNRAAVAVDEAALIAHLIELATKDSGMRLLRVLWYDAAKNGIPDPAQRQIGLIDNVKLRIGRINAFGKQKGVDLRLGLNLVQLGHRRAAEVAYLLSGDDDLTEAVTDAQDLGLQVKLLTVPVGDTDRPYAVAANLTLAADGSVPVDTDTVDELVTRTTRPTPTAPSAPLSTSNGSAAPVPSRGPAVVPPRPPVIPPAAPAVGVALTDPSPAPPAPEAPIPVYSSTSGSTDGVATGPQVWAHTAGPNEVTRLLAGRPNIPTDIDRTLLTDLVARSDRADIPTWARYTLREAFWNAAAQLAASRRPCRRYDRGLSVSPSPERPVSGQGSRPTLEGPETSS